VAKPAMMTTAVLNGIGRCGGDKESHEGAAEARARRSVRCVALQGKLEAMIY